MPEWLPPFNSALIVISGLVLIIGRVLIATGRRNAHNRAMLTACGFAIAFLIVYVTRAALYDPTPFSGTGASLTIYLTILAIHTVFAVAVIPFAFKAVRRGLAGDFAAHKKIAPVAFWIWLFVAGSGWVVYWMLYHLG